tara:strand:- start:1045 stop:1188 length:144 start_codon:yes stop_codon:yes gene_type:complete
MCCRLIDEEIEFAIEVEDEKLNNYWIWIILILVVIVYFFRRRVIRKA